MPIPFISIECPWNERYKSLEPPQMLNRGEYIWETQTQFTRSCPDPSHLNRDFIFVYFYTNSNGIKVTGATLLGSVDLDMLSLIVGPTLHTYPLQHSGYEGTVRFKITTTEIAPVTIELSSFLVQELEAQEQVFVEISTPSSGGNKINFEIQADSDNPKHYSNILPIPAYVAPFTYEQIFSSATILVKLYTQSVSLKKNKNQQNLSATLVTPGTAVGMSSSPAAEPVNQPSAFHRTLSAIGGAISSGGLTQTLMKTLHIRGPITDVGSFEIHFHELYEYDNPTVQQQETVYYNNAPIIISYTLRITNFPRYVQSARGEHINYGYKDTYTDSFYPPGTVKINEEILKRDSFHSLLPACNPPHNAVDTIDPVDFQLKFSDINCKSTQDLTNLSLIFYSVHCFNSKMIALNPLSSNHFTLPSSFDNKLEFPYSTRYLFELHKRYLNIECWSNSRSTYYGNAWISLHNLLSGPRKHLLTLQNGDMPESKITVEFTFSFEKSMIYYVEFDNISITKASKLGLRFRLDKTQQILAGIASPDDPSNLAFTKTTPMKMTIVTPCISPRAVKNQIEIEIMNNDLFHKAVVSSVCVELTQTNAVHAQETLIANYSAENTLACSMYVYSNTDHSGLYSDYISTGDSNTVFAVVQHPYANIVDDTPLSSGLIQSMLRNNYSVPTKVEILFSTVALPADLTLTVTQQNSRLSVDNIETGSQETLWTIYYDDLKLAHNTQSNVLQLYNKDYMIVMYMIDCMSTFKYISAIIESGGVLDEPSSSVPSAPENDANLEPVPIPIVPKPQISVQVGEKHNAEDDFRSSIKHSVEFNISDSIPPAVCRCTCGTYLSLVCKNCNKTVSTIQYHLAYLIKCSQCNKDTHIYSPNSSDFGGKCKNCDFDLHEMSINFPKLPPSDNTCIKCNTCDKYLSVVCPKCKVAPAKRVIYYKVECTNCHSSSLVGKRGKVCTKCKTPYEDFIAITSI